MIHKNKKDIFSIIWSFCLVILLVVCFSSFSISLRGTHAYFGGGTTGSFTVYTVYYQTNYPDDVTLKNKYSTDKQGTNFNILLENMFDVPDGYKFVGWEDIDGISHLPGEEVFLKADTIMYAKWEVIIVDVPEPDEGETEGDGSGEDNSSDNVSNISYGDINLNGQIDEDDYVLVEEHVNGSNILTGNALTNADVNVDGKIDLIDVDIIKNAHLGTSGYVGYLPNNPILIYDIYEGNIDIGNGGTGGSDEGNSGDGGNTSNNESSVSGGGTGSGSTGSGSSGSGHGGSSGGETSSGSGSGGSASSGGSSNNQQSGGSSDNNENDEEVNVESEKKIYEFKYMNGKLEFASTSCETISDTCEIILPDKKPVRSGYTFKGWSKNKDCSGDNIVDSPIMVDSGSVYYACYLKNVESENTGNKYYVWIIVFAISGLSLRLIWHLIYKFRHEESKDEN